MNNWTIPLIIIAVVAFVAAMITIIKRNNGETVVMTEVEENTSNYRTATITHIAQVCKYWLGESITSNPEAYNNDESTATYLDYTTESGSIHIEVNWITNKITMSYNFYDNIASRHITVKGHGRIKHGTTPDNKIVDFLRQVLNAELDLAKPYHDLLTEFVENGQALAQTLGEEGQEYDEPYLLATILSFLTAAIVDRHPTPTEARAYVTFIAYIRRFHPEILSHLREFLPGQNALKKLDDEK